MLCSAEIVIDKVSDIRLSESYVRSTSIDLDQVKCLRPRSG